ncbi:MAG TPA: hypothetical protein VGS11_03585 [Candidatus Bathyarchaeia archaeon]|nr:hypothetical protein [Candidatus Bathyarchaeia archaeon]
MAQAIRRYWSSVPGFARILLAVQAIVIVGLAGWVYNEYLNNQYLQVYMYGLLAGRESMLAIVGFGGLVGTALIGILLKAGNILGEIEHLSEKVEAGSDMKTVGVQESSPMPVLKIARPETRDEIGQLHGSMQRWKKRSNYEE